MTTIFVLTCLALAQELQPAQESPRDLLRLLAFDDGHFSKFRDGAGVGAEEDEVVAQLLHTLRRIEPVYLERWAKDSLPQAVDDKGLTALRRSPAVHRGACLRLSGYVTRVTLQRPLPKLAQRLELDRFYRCECVVGEREQPAVVYALRVPEVWRLDGELKEPVSFYGLFLKLLDGGQRAPMAFAAPRVAWHPPTLAGKHGVDAGLFDGVPHHSLVGAGDERECFYQLLSAMARALSRELTQAAEEALRRLDESGQSEKPRKSKQPQPAPQFPVNLVFDQAQEEERLRRAMRDLVELRELAWRIGALRRQRLETTDLQQLAEIDEGLTQAAAVFETKAEQIKTPPAVAKAEVPDTECWLESQLAQLRTQRAQHEQSLLAQGQVMVFEGIARQAVRVRVDDPVIRERFGLDHYYEVMVFVSGNFLIRDSGQRLGSLPVKCCLRSWPPEMPLGENIAEHVRLAGVFFKIWPYSSALSTELGPNQRQFAPLLVGREPIWYPAEVRATTWHVYLGIGMLLALVPCLVFWHWLTRRGDRKFRQQAIERNFEPPAGGSLDGLKIE